jgi:hypothetical protein
MSEITERIGKVLDKNRGKDFVERIINPWDSPVIEMPDGTRKTHYMSWGESDGKYYVYPNVMRDGEELKDYTDYDAWGKAWERGEYIEFDNAEDAEWFSKNYKQVWPEGMR